MATFITFGYGDESGYRRTPEQLRQAAHAQDSALVAHGAVMGRADTPTPVRNHEADGARTEAGAYLRSDLPIAGFAVVGEARTPPRPSRWSPPPPAASPTGWSRCGH